MKKTFLIFITFLGFITTAQALTTQDFPITFPNANFSAIPFTPLPDDICGHIGMDMKLVDDCRTNGQCDTSYNPCKNTDDPFHGACALSNSTPISYYKVIDFHHQGAIFIDNQNDNTCVSQPWCQSDDSFIHNWGKREKDVALEFYPRQSCQSGPDYGYNPFENQYGGVRITLNHREWDNFSNGGVYSDPLGPIPLPELGVDPNINGFITQYGSRVPAHTMQFEYFQNATPGQRVTGFAAFPNNDNGYHTTGPMVPGNYQLYLTYHPGASDEKKIIINRDIVNVGQRLDINLNNPDWMCFGITRDCKLLSQPVISLQSHNGRYVATDGNNPRVAVGATHNIRDYTHFYMVDVGGGKVALKTHDGYFLQALHGGNNVVKSTSTAVGAWEKFTLVNLAGGKVAFRTHRGYYLRALHGGNNLLDAKGGAIGAWEKFTLRTHSSPL
jgi:hypothetical protein